MNSKVYSFQTMSQMGQTWSMTQVNREHTYESNMRKEQLNSRGTSHSFYNQFNIATSPPPP